MTISEKEKVPEPKPHPKQESEDNAEGLLNTDSLILSLIQFANAGVDVDDDVDEDELDEYSVTYPESKVTEVRYIGEILGEDVETFAENVQSDLIDKLAEVLDSILAKKILTKLNEQNDEDIATIKGIEEKIWLSLRNGTKINHEQFFEELRNSNPEIELGKEMIQELVAEINRILPNSEEDGQNAEDGN